MTREEARIKQIEIRAQENCISRQQAIDKMQELEDEDIEAYGCAIPEGFDGKRAIEALKTLPSIQPKPKTGHWKERALVSDEIRVGDKYFLVCSNCNLGIPKGLLGFANYRPNCGAKMESEEA